MAKGFNRPPGGGKSQGGMMAQLQRMQQQLADAQAALAEETVTASAGGGAIKVTMTGDQKCRGVVIDPALLEDADAEMLQDLVLSVNLALDQSAACFPAPWSASGWVATRNCKNCPPSL
jgi:DNA-binding YbaB/EbfC family protein